MKRKITGFVLLILCMCLIKGTASSAATQVAAGSCGEHATWTLDDENVLTIRGTGKISDKSWEQSWEWGRITDYPSPNDNRFDIEEDDPHFVTVNIEYGITEIGGGIFASPYIKKVSIPDSVSRIGAYAFEKSSIKRIDIPDSVIEIGCVAFSDCRQLTDVHLPKNLTKIPHHMFYECIALESVTIPDYVTEIGQQAFDRAENLKEITFGKSLAVIPEKVFADCLRLRKIVNHSSTSFNFLKIGVVTKRVTWYANGAKAVDISPGTTVTGEGKQYKIRYVMKGTKVKGTLPKSFRYGEKVELPDQVTKKGYIFVGWSVFHDRGGGWWETLYRDSRGVICYDGLLEEMSENPSYKISPNFIKVKIQKKSKKTIIHVDCRKLPRVDLALDFVAIRYADNKKMKKFKIKSNKADTKNWKMKFVLPKSFRNRKCYIQFALVDDEDSGFSDYFKEVGWEIVDTAKWFWSKTVVSKGK